MRVIAAGVKSYPVSSMTAAAGLRVKLSAGILALAGATDIELGTLERNVASDMTSASVVLRTAEGTCQFVAADAITAGANLYAAASGKVSASGTVICGAAMTASSANNDLIEGLRGPNTDLTVGGAVQTVTAAADSGAGSTILAAYRSVNVTGVTNDANDWVVLPPIAEVPIGHSIRIMANAGSNFELRTPATSNTKINDVDSDGSQEYLVTNTDMVIVTKQTTTGWVAQSITKLGAVRAAVVPD